jgi:hypothetical protein
MNRRNNELTVETTINGRKHKATFIRSEDAGYRPGKWLLDLPNGDRISIYAGRGGWVEATIRNQVAISTIRRQTLTEACNSAAETLAAMTLDTEAFSS